jgi:flavin-dependent dehydrogenase
MATRRQIEADIVVVGAGPAGATASRLLALSGREVTLLDPKIKTIDRLEVMPPAGRGLMVALGLSHLLADPTIARRCAGIRRRWNATEPVLDDFLFHPGGAGFVLDRTRFDAGLREMARAAGVVPLRGRLAAAQIVDGVAMLEGSGEEPFTIRARLAIDATGRPAALARRLGAHRALVDAIVAERVENSPSAPGARSAWLDIVGHGRRWSYAALGPDRNEQWVVDVATSRRSGKGSRVDASAALLEPAAGEGWMAIGDAAACFDPIASQGLVNAFAAAREAARRITLEGAIGKASATAYSELVGSTFRHSEAGRREVYRIDGFEPTAQQQAAGAS